MTNHKQLRVDQIDIIIPLNSHDGEIPNLTQFKITQIKKFFKLSVNHDKLKELRVSHFKIANLGLSKLKVENGVVTEFPNEIKLTIYGTTAIINFNLLNLGSCFSLEFYEKSVWGDLHTCFLDDHAGKTQGIRKFSNKSFDEVLEMINDSLGNGKMFAVK